MVCFDELMMNWVSSIIITLNVAIETTGTLVNNAVQWEWLADCFHCVWPTNVFQAFRKRFKRIIPWFFSGKKTMRKLGIYSAWFCFHFRRAAAFPYRTPVHSLYAWYWMAIAIVLQFWNATRIVSHWTNISRHLHYPKQMERCQLRRSPSFWLYVFQIEINVEEKEKTTDLFVIF